MFGVSIYYSIYTQTNKTAFLMNFRVKMKIYSFITPNQLHTQSSTDKYTILYIVVLIDDITK